MTTNLPRVLIADDEDLALLRLRRLLEDSGRVSIVAQARDLEQVHLHWKVTKPDAVFLDLDMPGGTALDYVSNRLAAANIPRADNGRAAAVIFVTAHPQHAHQAFDINALDYLVKPISVGRVQQCLDKLEQHRYADKSPIDSGHEGTLRCIALTAIEPRRMVLRQPDRIDLVPIEDIECCVARANYIEVITATQTFMVRETLSAVEQLLKDRGFLRVHRSYLVQAQSIINLIPVGNGEYRLALRGGKMLESSRSAREAILAALGILSSKKESELK
jgi:two-component system LytT family response regulator